MIVFAQITVTPYAWYSLSRFSFCHLSTSSASCLLADHISRLITGLRPSLSSASPCDLVFQQNRYHPACFFPRQDSTLRLRLFHIGALVTKKACQSGNRRPHSSFASSEPGSLITLHSQSRYVISQTIQFASYSHSILLVPTLLNLPTTPAAEERDQAFQPMPTRDLPTTSFQNSTFLSSYRLDTYLGFTLCLVLDRTISNLLLSRAQSSLFLFPTNYFYSSSKVYVLGFPRRSSSHTLPTGNPTELRNHGSPNVPQMLRSERGHRLHARRLRQSLQMVQPLPTTWP